MIFNSFDFFIVFPVLFLLYWFIPSKYNKTRNSFLLIVSYLLYMNWKPTFAIVLLLVTIVTYIGGRILSEVESHRKTLLVYLFCLLGALPLLIFKYYNFLNENVVYLLKELGVNAELKGLNYAIPVGLSFFTFQSLGYVMDVYHKRIKAEKDFFVYALFVSFFPQITSGPISSAKDLMPQFKKRHLFSYSNARNGLQMLLWGIFLKVAFADRLGVYVDAVLGEYDYYDWSSCLFASFFYVFQIYGDFAGYSCMAIGVAKLLDFDLINNFKRPYFATSITEFWKRWHISLTRWLTTHIYINLGGNRCSKRRQYLNIMITFLVSGLWHGANWTFVIWGCIHGLLQILEKQIGLDPKGHLFDGLSYKQTLWLRPFRIISTLFLVSVLWIFFRMPTVLDSIAVIKRIVFFEFGVKQSVSYPIVIFTMFCILIGKELAEEYNGSFKKLFDTSIVIRWMCYIILLCYILSYGVLDFGQFIYVSF